MKSFLLKGLSLIFCVCFLMSLENQAQTISIAEARATADDDTVAIKGIVTRVKGRLAYVQDETAAIPIYESSGAFRDSVDAGAINIGDSLEVRGTRTTFRTFEEVAPISFSVLSSGNVLPDIQVVTVADLMENGESYEAELIHVAGLTVADTGVWESSTNYNVTDSTGTMILRIPSGIDNEIAGANIPTDTFSFTGVLGVFDSTYQLSPILTSDITVSPPTSIDESLIELYQFNAYPNPAKDAVTFEYTLTKVEPVEVKIVNLTGQEIITLQEGKNVSGNQQIRWNLTDALGSKVTSGIYFARLAVGKYVATYSVVVME